MAHTKRPRGSEPSHWKGDVLACLVVVIAATLVIKGCNRLFPGDPEGPPPLMEESR